MRSSPSAVGTRPQSGSSPRKKTGLSSLSNELVNTYKVTPFVLSPRPSPSARTARSGSTGTATCFREPEALQQDLHTARAQINELVYERKVLKTKTCALEEELRKMDARYEELLSINIITRTASTSLVGSSAEIPEDKTIRNLRLALKNLTRRSKEQEKEIAELKESMRFNKLYQKEQECIALFQETLKLRHALSNARTATPTTPTTATKPEPETELDDLRHRLAVEEQERKSLEGTCRKLQSDNAALTTQLGEAESKCRLSQLVLDEAEHRWRSDGERERTALRSANQELEARIARLDAEHREAESAARDVETKLARDLAAARKELDAKNQAAARLEESAEKSTKLLADAERRGEELEGQVVSWRTEVEELVSALESAQEQLSKVQRKRDEHAQSDSREVDELKSALAAAKSQFDEHVRQSEAERAKQAQEAEEGARALAHAESQIEEQQRQLEETSQIRANEVNEAAALAKQSDKYRHDLQEMQQRNEELEALVKTLRTAQEESPTYSPKRSASVQSLKNVVVTNTSSPPSESRPGSRSRVNVSAPVKKATAAAEEPSRSTADPPPRPTTTPAPAPQQPPQEDDFRVHHLSRAVSTEFFEKQMQVDAAIAIQAVARGYLVRRSLPPAYKRRRHAQTPSVAS
ncbi:hypothetical protein BDZ88DRAFT_478585 [Geranomyces variabilis]|nr:hypothetical protein BDZ88DRAFT_478585 [Geranomyces variabilis]KAJ3137709.1 hypothetical protein HDU90_001659 [Geranomyces variabilis]